MSEGSAFFQNSTDIEKVRNLLSMIESTVDGYEQASPEKQPMYAQGMELWAQDLQEAIQALGNGTTNITTTK